MRRELKAALLVLGLLGLLVLVALAARGGHPSSSGEVTPRAVPASAQDSFVTLLAIFYAFAIAAVIVLLFRGRHRFQARDDSHWLRNYVVVVGVMAIATVLGYLAITHGVLEGEQNRAQGAGQTQQQRTRQDRAREVPVRQAEFQWPIVVGVLGLVLLGGAAFYLRRRRESFGPAQPPTLEDDLARAVTATIEDLQREPDPRRAVVAAYAHMEGVLAAHGLARRRADAPLEYLARILRELEVRESAVATITELFEYAKFSAHEVDEEMKQRAIGALLAIRDDLRADEPVAA